VKVRSPGSTSPAVEARAGKKYARAEPVKLEARTSQPQPRTDEPVVARDTKPQPRAAAPVAQPVARGAKPEEVARDTTYVFGNVITDKHYTQHDHFHKEGTTIIVDVTPADGTGGTFASGPGTGKGNTGNAGTGNADTGNTGTVDPGTSSVLVPGGSSDVKTPSGTPTASATSAASGIVSGNGAPSSVLDVPGGTATAGGIVSATASGAPSSALGAPGGTATGVPGAGAAATVTVTVTATPTGTVSDTNPGSGSVSATGPSVSAAGPSVSAISSDPASSTATTKLKPVKVKGLSQGATTASSSGIGDHTVATGTPATPAKREPGHPWMRMMRRDTTPVTRRRSIIWGR